MALDLYNQKRDFTQTPEPYGVEKHNDVPVFVIQRHKASQLHYDFRIEVDGVLKSWAVPKGPSMNTADKRLAMMTEDHPVDYATFEGVIPEGNYGGGVMEIWDSGTFTLSDENPDAIKALEKGKIKIVLHGSKARGLFTLSKIKNPTAKENAWLLIKQKDEYAVSEQYNSEDYTPEDSAVTKEIKNQKSKVKND